MSTITLEHGRVVPSIPMRYDESRHPAYDTVVRADPNAGLVLLRDTPEDNHARPVLEGAGYVRSVVDGFVVYGRPTR